MHPNLKLWSNNGGWGKCDATITWRQSWLVGSVVWRAVFAILEFFLWESNLAVSQWQPVVQVQEILPFWRRKTKRERVSVFQIAYLISSRYNHSHRHKRGVGCTKAKTWVKICNSVYFSLFFFKKKRGGGVGNSIYSNFVLKSESIWRFVPRIVLYLMCLLLSIFNIYHYPLNLKSETILWLSVSHLKKKRKLQENTNTFTN